MFALRSFPVPIQITEAEKIFGGHLSLKQVAYIFIIGPAIGFLFALLCPFGGLIADVAIISGGVVIGLVLSFIRISDIGIDEYFWLALKWYKSPRVYRWDK